LVLVEIIKDKRGDFEIKVVVNVFVVTKTVKEEFSIVKETVYRDISGVESKS